MLTMPEIRYLDVGLEDIQHAAPRKAQKNGANGGIDVPSDGSRLIRHARSVLLCLLNDIFCQLGRIAD